MEEELLYVDSYIFYILRVSNRIFTQNFGSLE